MKKILFITGTRADFGKLKALVKSVQNDKEFEYTIFVTGMHTLSKYGLTVEEIKKAGFKDIYMYMNQLNGDPMDLVLANTITGLSRYVSEYKPDMIVVHGDRVEALAGAIVGSLNNILVSHVEGGELSGTIDGVIRHAITKLSHIHLVSNEEAAKRLYQLGEMKETVYTIGSPDIDIMLSKDLPSIEEVKKYYNIDFEEYAILLFHPVTTEVDELYNNTVKLLNAVIASGLNYVVIYPNNDFGCNEIFRAYDKIKDREKIKMFPSLRFEYFLTLLKNTSFVIGNSSAGIREAPIFGIPSVNIGSRQKERFFYQYILDASYDEKEILTGIERVLNIQKGMPCYEFGTGNSAKHFMDIIKNEKVWKTPKQKGFIDLLYTFK